MHRFLHRENVQSLTHTFNASDSYRLAAQNVWSGSYNLETEKVIGLISEEVRVTHKGAYLTAIFCLRCLQQLPFLLHFHPTTSPAASVMSVLKSLPELHP